MHYNDHLDDDALRRYATALNRRAADNLRSGHLTVDVLRGLILESRGACAWCGRSVVGDDIEIDHIMPLRRGGDHTIDNLAVTCPDCNRRKSDQHPATFAQRMVAQGGQRTVLVERVLRDYDVESIGRQVSLFGDDPPDDVESTDGYNWSNSG